MYDELANEIARSYVGFLTRLMDGDSTLVAAEEAFKELIRPEWERVNGFK